MAGVALLVMSRDPRFVPLSVAHLYSNVKDFGFPLMRQGFARETFSKNRW
jgi:hypothetical protein